MNEEIETVEYTTEEVQRKAVKWIDRLIQIRTGPDEWTVIDEIDCWLFLLGMKTEPVSSMTVEELEALRETILSNKRS